MNVALFLPAVPDLSGGGGAERFFANFHQYFNSGANKSDDKLFLITDKESLANLEKASLIKHYKNIIVLDTYQVSYANMFKLCFKLFTKKIKLVHIVNTYTHHNFNLIFKFNKIRSFFNVKLSVNNEVAELIEDLKEYNRTGKEVSKYVSAIKIILNNIHPSGFYTWYKPVENEMKASDLLDIKKCVVKSSEYCFTDLTKYLPSSERYNQIVYASRLSIDKNPLLLVEAANYLRTHHKEEMGDYKFFVYGKGVLKESMAALFEKYELGDFFTMSYSPTMYSILAHSKIFVSTQSLENFTSLSMLEAMACGNVIIAKNIGQTGLFVQDGKNGFLFENDDAINLALSILKAVLLEKEMFKKMSEQSVYLATKHHTVENFSKEIFDFFIEVLAKHK